MLISLLSGGNVDFINVVVYIISALAVIFLTLPVHEFSHGFTAVKLGDDTPRWQGRLTLNPFAHIDYFGALCILLFGFGWAKPVEVNTRNFRNPKRDMAITAFAGPLSNLIVSFLSLIITNIIVLIFGINTLLGSKILQYLLLFFSFIVQINISLAVFNLLPIPPLDGSRLLSAFLPDRLYYRLMQYERIIFFALFALLWIGVLDVPLEFLSNAVMSLFSKLMMLIFPNDVASVTNYFMLMI